MLFVIITNIYLLKILWIYPLDNFIYYSIKSRNYILIQPNFKALYTKNIYMEYFR